MVAKITACLFALGKWERDVTKNMQDRTVIGIDLAKSSFAIHAVDALGEPVFRKTRDHSSLLPFPGSCTMRDMD